MNWNWNLIIEIFWIHFFKRNTVRQCLFFTELLWNFLSATACFSFLCEKKKIVLALYSMWKEKDAKHRAFLFLLVIHLRTVEKLVQATEQNGRFFNFDYLRPRFHAQCIEITHSEQKRLSAITVLFGCCVAWDSKMLVFFFTNTEFLVGSTAVFSCKIMDRTCVFSMLNVLLR